MFIDEIQAIVQDNISNEKFGVSELASALGLSNSQTLRKVKAATGKSVNQYIREFRLKEAAKLIKTTDDTIAEISYKVGFASPSYFNKAFSKYFNVAPGEYKTQSNNSTETVDETNSIKKQSKIFKKPVLLAIAAILICVIGYVVINNSIANKSTLPNSIAVLPFKDFSPVDTQWFCDGVSDNILHSLAQMKDLTVTSFTSSSTYRNSEKQIPEIAKELGVSYVLEGSVVLHNGKLKVITQLIDANDKHVWSKEYNDSFENVIAIQQNVAREVMKQLEITLSPTEVETLSKYPTENMEAYNLHLEGRLINHSRKREDLQKNIEYNKKAIALDSSFVDAYAEVAAGNMLFGIERNLGIPKYIKEATTYANKALKLDPNSAKANAVTARLLFGTHPEDSKKYFEKAIMLNPNDAETRYWYAYFFMITSPYNYEASLEHAEIANKLSPFSSLIAHRYVWTLILNEKFDDAQQFLDKYNFLFNPVQKIIFDLNLIGYRNKDFMKVFPWLFNKLESEPESAAFYHLYISICYDLIDSKKNKVAEHAKLAYELNSDNLFYYFRILVRNGFYDEVDRLMETDDYKGLTGATKFHTLWLYQYHKGNYREALQLINDNTQFLEDYNIISRTYAQLGERTKLDSINRIYFLSTEYKYVNKAIVHGILGERDSMYYYMGKHYGGSIALINVYPEYDPYKNEKRFKALLRRAYMPVSKN